jgi:hypothetical protein
MATHAIIGAGGPIANNVARALPQLGVNNVRLVRARRRLQR